jgi:hypothetical protein
MEHSTLDGAQARALISCLKRKLGLIQGPPGTGKSYTHEAAEIECKARLGSIQCRSHVGYVEIVVDPWNKQKYVQDHSTLDGAQARALISCLKRKLGLIQGPPGLNAKPGWEAYNAGAMSDMLKSS